MRVLDRMYTECLEFVCICEVNRGENHICFSTFLDTLFILYSCLFGNWLPPMI